MLILVLIPPIDHGSDLLFLERVSSTYPTLDGLVTGKGLLTGARLVLRMMRLARYAISDYFYIITREKYWPCFFIHQFHSLFLYKYRSMLGLCLDYIVDDSIRHFH